MAVYTTVSDDELTEFLSRYDLGEVLAFKGIAEGVENSNFLLQTEHGNHILTLYEKRVAPEDLPYFLALMRHLAANGVDCPLPIAACDGSALQSLCGRPAAIISFLEGLWPRRIHPFHCRELGERLARMHLAGADFSMTRPNNLSIDGWRPLLEACGPRSDEVRLALFGELNEELGKLESEWPEELPQGVIHADLFPDNVFFRNERLTGFIDFYFACNDALAYDVAVCLNAWCFEPDGSFNITKAQQFLANYRAARPLDERELLALPLLCRGAALRFLLTRLFDWLNHPPGAFVKPKDPLEYYRKLRFHADCDGPGAYGL